MFACLFLFVQRSIPWQDEDISKQQDGVYLPASVGLSSAIKEDNSELTAVIMKGWLEKNPPQGYELRHMPEMASPNTPHRYVIQISYRSLYLK